MHYYIYLDIRKIYFVIFKIEWAERLRSIAL